MKKKKRPHTTTYIAPRRKAGCSNTGIRERGSEQDSTRLKRLHQNPSQLFRYCDPYQKHLSPHPPLPSRGSGRRRPGDSPSRPSLTFSIPEPRSLPPSPSSQNVINLLAVTSTAGTMGSLFASCLSRSLLISVLGPFCPPPNPSYPGS